MIISYLLPFSHHGSTVSIKENTGPRGYIVNHKSPVWISFSYAFIFPLTAPISHCKTNNKRYVKTFGEIKRSSM